MRSAFLLLLLTPLVVLVACPGDAGISRNPGGTGANLETGGEGAPGEGRPRPVNPHASPGAVADAFLLAWVERDLDAMAALVLPERVKAFRSGFKGEFESTRLVSYRVREVLSSGDDHARVTIRLSFEGIEPGDDSTPVERIEGKWYVAY